MTITVQIDDLSGPEIGRLLQAHLDFAAKITPAGSGHALDLDALRKPELTFWTAWEEQALQGCVALKELSQRHGEIKSMHTAQASRGRGVAKNLLQHLIDESMSRGYDRLSLETGNSEGFLPAQRLYQSFGFERCEPFGDYINDPFSFCMTKLLRAQS